jgi:hypothetical protein
MLEGFQCSGLTAECCAGSSVITSFIVRATYAGFEIIRRAPISQIACSTFHLLCRRRLSLLNRAVNRFWCDLVKKSHKGSIRAGYGTGISHPSWRCQSGCANEQSQSQSTHFRLPPIHRQVPLALQERNGLRDRRVPSEVCMQKSTISGRPCAAAVSAGYLSRKQPRAGRPLIFPDCGL